LELGGKSPNIVFDDATVRGALSGCIAAIFAASGQTCIAGSRLFLHAKVHDAFVERLLERTKRIEPGDPPSLASEMGPMATTDQLRKVQSFVDSAIGDAAELVYRGNRPDAPELRQARIWKEATTPVDSGSSPGVVYLARLEASISRI
jgi:aldehyde dehydrogenase (NAD+)